jgi:hypothetical protein
LRSGNVVITGGKDLLKYAVDMAPDGLIFIPGFVKIRSGVRNSMVREYTCKHTDNKVIS